MISKRLMGRGAKAGPSQKNSPNPRIMGGNAIETLPWGTVHMAAWLLTKYR